MRRVLPAALAAALLSVLTLTAGETAGKKKPLGTWTRTKDDITMTFQFTDDTIHFTSEGGLGKLVLETDYAVSKDGKVVFGRIRTIKEGAGPGKEDLFSFGCKVKGDTLTITDWRGSGGAGLAGAFLQGEYKKGETK